MDGGDDWDADGFEIPSLKPVENEIKADVVDEKKADHANDADKNQNQSQLKVEKEILYLGPHGAPPSQVKQDHTFNSNSSSMGSNNKLSAGMGRKQKLRQVIKEADKNKSGAGFENKLENLKVLMGSKTGNGAMTSAGTPKEWLDPFCHESEFERRQV